MSQLLRLDLHAHVDPSISSRDLLDLRAAVFAATRSLDEAELAVARNDERTAWGVGCHPRLVRAQRAFDPRRFARLIARTTFVSEVGLDGASRVPMGMQRAILDDIFGLMEHAPRLTSLHSYRASDEVIAALEARPIRGAILHWWLGDARQTQRAIDLGCYFSVNASSVRRQDLLDTIPLDRVLTETDHPFGDRRDGKQARPGGVRQVEAVLAVHHDLPVEQLRSTIWMNLDRLIGETGCMSLMPRGIRAQLAAL